MKTFCQYFVLISSIASFFLFLYRDINGRPASDPQGFAGVVGTIVIFVISLAIYYGAGAMSEILK